MKLYNVPPNSKILVGEEILDFKHIDGMYSKCYMDGDLIHLHACTEVEVLDKEVE